MSSSSVFDAELLGVRDVERVLRVDERRDPALLLHVRDRVQRERGLTARFRTVNLDDAATRIATDADRDVEPHGARGHHLHVSADLLAILQAHDGAVAELLLDTGNREL